MSNPALSPLVPRIRSSRERESAAPVRVWIPGAKLAALEGRAPDALRPEPALEPIAPLMKTGARDLAALPTYLLRGTQGLAQDDWLATRRGPARHRGHAWCARVQFHQAGHIGAHTRSNGHLQQGHRPDPLPALRQLSSPRGIGSIQLAQLRGRDQARAADRRGDRAPPHAA